MRILITFLLFLCYHFAGGSYPAARGNGLGKIAGTEAPITIKLVERTGPGSHQFIKSTAPVPGENDLLFIEEDETEEGFNGRKQRPQTILISDYFVATMLSSRSETCQHSSSTATSSYITSHKYLEQRVLRI